MSNLIDKNKVINLINENRYNMDYETYSDLIDGIDDIDSGYNDNISITVNSKSSDKVKNRHVKELLKMLIWMEYCGNIGHTVNFRVNYDGDGPAHLIFGFNDNKLYEEIKKEIIESYNSGDIKLFKFD